MLGAGCGTGQEEVTNVVRRGFLLHELVVLGLDAVDPRARLALRALPEFAEDELEILDLLACLPQVRLERTRQVASGRLAGELRQHLLDGPLRVVHVLQLVFEELLRCGHLCHHYSFRAVGYAWCLPGRAGAKPACTEVFAVA